tara:strand:+ start:1416 stop:2102 length:687 start_codon:yes stop_codon:yes gene_type:complete
MPPPENASDEVNVLLTILHQYDRLRTLFARWSVRRKTDRDLLSVQMHPTASIGSEFVAAMMRAFPFRVLGPFLVHDCLEFEILDRTLPHDTEERLPDAALFGAPARKRKDPDTLAGARRALLEELAEHNTAGVKVASVVDGQDANGVWMEMAIESTERVNLSFLQTSMLLDACENVKSLTLHLREGKPVLVLREYGAEERRILTSWEVVVAYKRGGCFAAVRRKVQFA